MPCLKIAPRLQVEALENRLAPAVHTWTGMASNLWSNPANWQGGSPAGDPKAELVFPSAAAQRMTINDLNDLTISSLSINSILNRYELRGNPIYLGAGGITASGQTTADHLVALDLHLLAPTVFTGPGVGTARLLLNGVISGDHEVIVETGRVQFLRANTYTGGTDLRGTALLGNQSALGTGEVRLSGTLYSSQNGNLLANPFRVEGPTGTIAGDFGITLTGPGMIPRGSTLRTFTSSVVILEGGLSGEGSLSNEFQSRLILRGKNTFTGLTLIEGGWVRLDSPAALDPAATVVLIPRNGRPRLELAAFDAQIGALVGVGDVEVALGSRTLVTGGNGNSTAFAGAIIGKGSVTKVGDETWTLSGANTFTGGLTVAAGTLRLTSRGAAGVGPLHVAGGAVEVAADVALSGPIVNEGLLAVEAGHALDLTPHSFHNAGLVELHLGASLRAGSLYEQAPGGATFLYDATLGARDVRIGSDSFLVGSGLIDADLENAGYLEVGGTGAAGELVVTGDFVQTATGSLWIELGDAAAGNYDRFIASEADLAGALVVQLLEDFVTREGDNFSILSWEAVDGGLESFFFPDLGDPFFLDAQQDETGFTLQTTQQ